MRVKHVWDYVPLPAKLKLLAARITFSKITIFYFVFSIVNCIIQIGLQSQAFAINANAAKFLNSIIVQGGQSQAGFAVLEKSDLRWCTSVPKNIDASACQVVWNGTSVDTAATDPENLVTGPAGIASSSAASSSTRSSSVSASTTTPSTLSTSSAISTATAIPTIDNIAQLASALQIAEAGGFDTSSPPTATATVTKTATVQVAPTFLSDASHVHKRKITADPHIVSAVAVNGSKVVNIGGINGQQQVTLSESCIVALNWPLGSVDNTKREDIVFIGFSVWVLGMSLVAVLNESPPHIVAAFLTHMLAAAWSAFQLVNTNTFHNDFSRLTTHGACGVNLLPNYWTQRAQFEIPTLAMNILTLLISAFLSWKLMKSFGWQTFKRIGASLTMSKAYRFILIFSILIQLSVFFIVVSIALWVDQVYNGAIGHLTSRATAFEGVTLTVLVLMIPWLTTGWISVRREYNIPMIIFLALSLLYLVGWSCMFLAPTFKWTFVEWRFFSLMAIAAAVLALAVFILGIICRCNFGKGLPRYLNAQEPLPGDDFEPATYPNSFSEKGSWGDEEKVDFPSYETSLPLPTYADMLPPPPAYMSNAPRILGPRFYGGSDAGAGIAFERPTITIDTSSTGNAPVRLSLARQGSGSSQRSGHSITSSVDSASGMRGKRWIIE